LGTLVNSRSTFIFASATVASLRRPSLKPPPG
jgi:hypothetical protein